ncbi:MAG: primosomal protein N', partial [Thermomicrobiales bacterium]
RETASTLYAAASPFFPPGVEHRTTESYELIDPDDPRIESLSPMPRRIVELLKERGEMTGDQLRRELGRNQPAALRQLEEDDFIERSIGVEDRIPKSRTARYARLIEFDPEAVSRSGRQREVLELMAQRERLLGDEHEYVPVSELVRQTGVSASVITALESKGLIEIVERDVESRRVAPDETSAPVLSPAQADAWKAIERSMVQGDPAPLLIYGVTGSGKTELYLRMAGRCLRDGKSMIMLVPEIVLATQIVQRFEERFPGQVAVLHSAQNAGERYAVWKAIQAGERSIVVGPRSALFAPVQELGAIAIDEEQDSAYKQESDPRYHARALAEKIAVARRSALVLGSATPSIETAWRTTRGFVRRVDLPERVRFDVGGIGALESRESAAMPAITVVDMRKEARTTGATLISGPLTQSIERALSNREQAVVLLNRRGMSTIVICRSCGTAILCPYCDIPMVYHRDIERLVCHRCNNRAAPPQRCDACGGPLDYFGAGTQRVEQEMRRYFPGASVMRIDRDSIRALGGFESVLRRIEHGEADIIVGTQIVAKGLDFPRVTTVGVVQADSQLHFPDFRSAERTFQLISQVAGRAGRRVARGDVVVQTYTPDHYAITAAANHSYEDFYLQEISFRQRFRYPPFSRMARYVFRSPSEQACREEGTAMANELAAHARTRDARVDLLGPAPAFVSRIRGEFQWQIVLRSSIEDFERLLDDLPARPGWIVDIDPNSVV